MKTESQRNYEKSEKGKEARRRYEQSEKGKAARARAMKKYRETEKGITTHRDYMREYTRRRRKELFANISETDKSTVSWFLSYLIKYEYREVGWTVEDVRRDLLDRWMDEEEGTHIDNLNTLITAAIEIAKDDAETNDTYGNGEFGTVYMTVRGVTREYTLNLRFYDVTVSTTSAVVEVLCHKDLMRMHFNLDEVAPWLKGLVSKNELKLVEAFLADHKY